MSYPTEDSFVTWEVCTDPTFPADQIQYAFMDLDSHLLYASPVRTAAHHFFWHSDGRKLSGLLTPFQSVGETGSLWVNFIIKTIGDLPLIWAASSDYTHGVTITLDPDGDLTPYRLKYAPVTNYGTVVLPTTQAAGTLVGQTFTQSFQVSKSGYLTQVGIQCPHELPDGALLQLVVSDSQKWVWKYPVYHNGYMLFFKSETEPNPMLRPGNTYQMTLSCNKPATVNLIAPVGNLAPGRLQYINAQHKNNTNPNALSFQIYQSDVPQVIVLGTSPYGPTILYSRFIPTAVQSIPQLLSGLLTPLDKNDPRYATCQSGSSSGLVCFANHAPDTPNVPAFPNISANPNAYLGYTPVSGSQAAEVALAVASSETPRRNSRGPEI
jgi:hypothetical protein